MINPYSNARATFRAMITSGNFKGILAMYRLVLLTLFFTGLLCHAQKASYIKFSPELNKDTLQITVIDTSLTLDIYMPNGTMKIKGKLALYNQYELKSWREKEYFITNSTQLEIDFNRFKFDKVSPEKPFNTIDFVLKKKFIYYGSARLGFTAQVLDRENIKQALVNWKPIGFWFRGHGNFIATAHKNISLDFTLNLPKEAIQKINIYDQDKLIWSGSYMQLLAEFFAEKNILQRL
jgi:hypothetical protein